MGEAKGTEASPPFPHQPYGALIALIGDQKVWAAGNTCWQVGEEGAEVKLGTNIPDHPSNRTGSGGLELRVESC
jgi:hypothetical protein